MKEYKYIFIYKTVNIITNRFYIGSHYTNNLNDKYIGSGVALNDAIKKYKRKNFKREILEFCTLENLHEREEFWIKKLQAVELGYNLTENVGGGYINEEVYKEFSKKYKGRKFKQESKDKLKESLKNVEKIICPHCNEEHTPANVYKYHFNHCLLNPDIDIEEEKQRRSNFMSEAGRNSISEFHKGNKYNEGRKHTPEAIEKIRAASNAMWESEELRAYFSEMMTGENNPMFGKTHTPEAIEKIRESKIGCTISEKQKEILREYAKKPKSEEHKKKIGKSLKSLDDIVCPYCGKAGKPFSLKQYHFDNCLKNPNLTEEEVLNIKKARTEQAQRSHAKRKLTGAYGKKRIGKNNKKL